MINTLQCIKCKHFDETPRTFKCTAFPDGIPDQILLSEHDHKKPFPGDNGIHFEPITPSKPIAK
jgi:hypothetical protein